MEKINIEEAQRVAVLKKGRSTLLRAHLLQLQVGEGLLLKFNEWHAKRLPYGVASRLQKTHGRVFEYGRHPNGTGWLFRRVG